MKIMLKGKSNVYEQIVDSYKRYIKLGVLKYDDKLPSCRQLASELGVNPNTVVRAYNVLENEGYIKVLPKKGVYVTFEDVSSHLNEVKSDIEKIKNSNVTYDELIKIVNDVYGREKK